MLATIVVLACAVVAGVIFLRPQDAAVLPDRLEPIPGVSQCNYEMLRAFSGWAADQPQELRYTLGAGTLLGAMRTYPTGLLQWEHDVDLYIPARDASTALQLLQEQCSGAASDWKSQWCATLHFRGLVDEREAPCCGFGFKLYHRTSEACQLDVLVLAQTTAPFLHGETPWWPPEVTLAGPIHALASALHQQLFFVIPEDVHMKLLMGDKSRWCKSAGQEWEWCGGPQVSYFQDEYFKRDELFPPRYIDFYNLRLPIPKDPWSSLNRTYGTKCGHIARLSEHGSIEFDMRLPENAHLREPANITVLPL